MQHDDSYEALELILENLDVVFYSLLSVFYSLGHFVVLILLETVDQIDLLVFKKKKVVLARVYAFEMAEYRSYRMILISLNMILNEQQLFMKAL